MKSFVRHKGLNLIYGKTNNKSAPFQLGRRKSNRKNSWRGMESDQG